jgi:subtilisin family serine protease
MLMERTAGNPEVVLGLIDGPVTTNHPELSGARLRDLSGRTADVSSTKNVTSQSHGTFVAGILCAQRNSVAPAICPGCTVLMWPIFGEAHSAGIGMPNATSQQLAEAIIQTTNAGARVLNLSVGLVHSSTRGERDLVNALDHAMQRGVLVIAAAGNQAMVGSTIVTRHPWVLPVAACDLHGHPVRHSNLGRSIATHGLAAPGEGVTSLVAQGTATFAGTSAAAPFVTGTAALLWSLFPGVHASSIKVALTQSASSRTTNIIPKLLNAAQAYRTLAKART